MVSKIDYKAEVKKIHPTAKCYNTGTILHCVDVYHVGVENGKEIKILVPSHEWAGNRNLAWQKAYEHLQLLTTAIGAIINIEL